METIYVSICYRILYQSTTRENIESLICDRYNSRNRWQTLNDSVRSHKDRCIHAIQSGRRYAWANTK